LYVDRCVAKESPRDEDEDDDIRIAQPSPDLYAIILPEDRDTTEKACIDDKIASQDQTTIVFPSFSRLTKMANGKKWTAS